MVSFGRKVSEDEVIGFWLRYEFNSKPNEKAKVLQQILPFIDSDDYSSREGNFWRYFALWNYYRSGLLSRLPSRDEIEWYEATVDEDDYDSLLLIASSDWITLSNNTCEVPICARRIQNESQQLLANPAYSSQVNFILNLVRDFESGKSIDPRLILIGKRTGPFTVIDGVHRCIAKFICHFLKKSVPFSPHNVYVGLTDRKSIWQHRN